MKIREVTHDINTGEVVEREITVPRKTAAQKRAIALGEWKDEIVQTESNVPRKIEDIIDAMAPTVRARLPAGTIAWHTKRKEIRARKP